MAACRASKFAPPPFSTQTPTHTHTLSLSLSLCFSGCLSPPPSISLPLSSSPCRQLPCAPVSLKPQPAAACACSMTRLQRRLLRYCNAGRRSHQQSRVAHLLAALGCIPPSDRQPCMGPQEGHATAEVALEWSRIKKAPGGTGVVAQLHGPGSGQHAPPNGPRNGCNNPNRDCHWVGVPDPGCTWCPSTAFVQLSRLCACMNGQSPTLEQCTLNAFQRLEHPSSQIPDASLAWQAGSCELWQSQVRGCSLTCCITTLLFGRPSPSGGSMRGMGTTDSGMGQPT